MDKNASSQRELENYVCGGYFIAKVASRSGPVEFCEICKARLPSDEIITVSTCLTATLPNDWAFEWTDVVQNERRKRARIWDLRDSDLDKFVKWTTERFQAGEIGYPNVFLALNTVRDLLGKFSISRNGWNLLGVGLLRDNVARLTAEYAPTNENELSPVIAKTVSRRLAPDPSGHIIGYEVLGWEIDGFHSWFCSLPLSDVSGKLSIRPSSNGLLESYTEAAKIAAAASQPHDAVPNNSVAWFPWAIIRYPV